MRVRTGWMAALALLCAVPRAVAQTPATPDTPDQTVRAFLVALNAQRWTEAAAFLSDAEVRPLRDLTLAWALARLEEMRDPTSDFYAMALPGRVDSVRLKRFAGRPVTMRGVSTLGEAAALEPREFVARLMEMARPGTHRYMGVAVENDSVAHADVREVKQDHGVDQEAEVLELRREAGRWYVVPNTKLFFRASLLDVPDRG